MPDYRVKFSMSQNGRSSRDTHSIAFRIQPEGSLSLADCKQFSLDLSFALASVMFAGTSFLRTSWAKLDASGHAVKGASFSYPMSRVGFNDYEEDDGGGPEHLCLAIEKSGGGGKPGVSYLRHCMSAVEYAEYLNAGTIPARFTSSPAMSYNATHSIEVNIQKALDDNSMIMKLPPIIDGGSTTERSVDTIAVQDFRLIQPTKIKRSAESQIAHGIQRELDAIARKAWRLWKAFAEGFHPADVLTLIATLITSYWSAYNAIAAGERALIAVRALPVLL